MTDSVFRRDRNVRREMHACTDAQLIAAMREGIEEAWTEYDARFRPLLETYAQRLRIPTAEWSTCIPEVLDDVALRLVAPNEPLPANLSGYLVRAVRYRYAKSERAARRRARYYAAAAEPSDGGPPVVRGLVSESTLRSSAGPMAIAEDRGDAMSPLSRFAVLLTGELSTEERHLLGWVGEGVARRQIAAWMGITYEATKKRISRLSRRLRALTPSLLTRLHADERREVERFLRRTAAHPAPTQRREGTR